MNEFTITRLFSDPDLNGVVPLSPKFSPDATRISYLLAGDDNQERLNLWEYHIGARESRMLVDAGELSLPDTVLSDQEKAHRERKRITQSGIVEYHWRPDSKSLLVPVDGDLYLYALGTGELTRLAHGDTSETDMRFSPDGRSLSFVRDQDMYLLDVDRGRETRLTFDGGGVISNGVAEFVAQEEMHRFEGYWWSPDSRRIAYIQVDEGPVELSRRFEIDAEAFRVFDQRYPFAGTANARVRLGVTDIHGNMKWVDLARDPESYIARVNWLADSERLAIQLQSRDQRQLDLVICNLGTGEQHLVLSERSDTWVNLNDNFRALKTSDHILWGSERSGFNHLYLVDVNGNIEAQITDGDGVVAAVHGVDETRRLVWFDGYLDTPLERHLYVAPLDGGAAPQRITEAGGSHQVDLAADLRHFLDRESSATTPVSVTLRGVEGEPVATLAANTLDGSHAFFPFVHLRGDVEFGNIAAADGQRLYYRLIKPQAGGDPRYPVIVTVYGGPGVQRVTNEWIAPWHHYMASRGYGLLQLDNRGSTHRGTRFEAPIHRRLGEVEVADQLAGVDFLKSLDWVDAARIGVFGHSYGGYMALMLMMKAPDVFRAGVSVAPVTDWRLYDTHYTERYLGVPEENAEGYEASSVFPHVANLSGNLLMIHGMADDNVLFTHSTKLYKVLQDTNIEFDMMTYPGAKHGLAGRNTNIHRYTLMDRFFDRHLKELERPFLQGH